MSKSVLDSDLRKEKLNIRIVSLNSENLDYQLILETQNKTLKVKLNKEQKDNIRDVFNRG